MAALSTNTFCSPGAWQQRFAQNERHSGGTLAAIYISVVGGVSSKFTARAGAQGAVGRVESRPQNKSASAVLVSQHARRGSSPPAPDRSRQEALRSLRVLYIASPAASQRSQYRSFCSSPAAASSSSSSCPLATLVCHRDNMAAKASLERTYDAAYGVQFPTMLKVDVPHAPGRIARPASERPSMPAPSYPLSAPRSGLRRLVFSVRQPRLRSLRQPRLRSSRQQPPRTEASMYRQT